MIQQPNKKVISFLSAAGNIGTTSTAFSIAQSLSKQTDARIGVLCLNPWDDSTDYIESPSAFLDSIKSRLAGKMLGDDAELIERFTEISPNSLYILAGNRNRRLERQYSTEEIDYLIDRAKDIFDLVLIDAGSHMDNPLSAQAVYVSDTHYVVINQQPKVLKRFRQQHDDILYPLSIEKNNMHFLLNMYQEKNYKLTDKQIAKELDIDSIFPLPLVEDAIVSELENKVLYSYNNAKYQASIDTVAKQIAETAHINLKETVGGKKGFLAFRK